MGAATAFIVMGLIATSQPDYRLPLTDEEYAQVKGMYLCQWSRTYYSFERDPKICDKGKSKLITEDMKDDDAAQIRRRIELNSLSDVHAEEYEEINKKYEINTP
jgi:hypothetical protein